MDTVDLVILIVALLGLTGVIGGLLFVSGALTAAPTPQPAQQEEQDDAQPVPEAGGRQARGLRQRRGGGAGAGAGGNNDQFDDDVDPNASGSDGEGVDSDGEPIDLTNASKKQIIKARRRQARDEAKAAREATAEAARKKLEKTSDYQRLQEEREAAREAEEARLEEERKKEEEAEFESWKGAFTVEEEGEDAEDEETAANLLEQFVEHIKRKKTVVLEELAAEFGLKTKVTIERVEALEKAGRISGVIDDRGKFIYITDDEMAKVAKFIGRKGRVSQAELAAESNKLIDLQGSDD